MKHSLFYLSFLPMILLGAMPVHAHIRPPRPPVIVVPNLRVDEKPVAITQTQSIVASNPYFERTKVSITFTNPNLREMSGELQLPLPDGAIVCGYALEINGEMVPGVVCEKEKARIAFENEERKGVDPGIVEHVKGNLWRTRIYPLLPKTPRKAEIDYIAPILPQAPLKSAILERDGEDFFLAEQNTTVARPSLRDTLGAFTTGIILWDASLSAEPHAAAWRERLTMLPDVGEWQLYCFRNRPGMPSTFKTKADLLAAIDALVYDGGTDLGAAFQALPQKTPVLLFSDEIDTLGLTTPDYETREGLTIASRAETPARDVTIQKLTRAQAEATGLPVTEGTLLATVWASRRMQDLANQADARKDEFLALGRKYGVAGPGLSLIVLETLEQWLEYKIEPPKQLHIHAEWVKRRAAMDDPIADKMAKAEHEAQLLRYWEERVKWWNDPKPKKQTPSSGLFNGLARAFSRDRNDNDDERDVVMVAEVDMEEAEEEVISIDAPPLSESVDAYRFLGSGAPENAPAPQGQRGVRRSLKRKGTSAQDDTPTATITLKPWNPDTPYLKAMDANPEDAYNIYLKERKTYADSPAFYLDCAGWFLKQKPSFGKEQPSKSELISIACTIEIAERIITNLAEFKLEDPALWRTMGWRLREAKCYSLAIHCFRKVLTLRGEEGQSYRDLALVLMEEGKARAMTAPTAAKPLLEEAMTLFKRAAFDLHGRKSGRRGNDFQVAIIALEELNGLIAWIEAHEWPEGKCPAIPAFDAAYRRDLPVSLRIVMSWDADQTDIDIHVLEPNGEEAFYRNRRTAEGGFVSEDVTTGYGPEEYLKKDLEHGTYKILSNYYASHQTALTGATVITVTLYTDWGTAKEKQRTMTLRLNKPKEKHLIGEVTL